MHRLGAIVACVGFAAVAQDAGLGEIPLHLKVGQTLEVDAGPAVGFICDDVNIVSAEAKDRTLIVFTGLKPGSTLCRVGIDFKLPHHFYQLIIESE
jgi:hypothetical protein